MLYSATYVLWTEYYAEVWGVSRESVRVKRRQKKKWIVHVKIDKSRGDCLRGVGRDKLLL